MSEPLPPEAQHSSPAASQWPVVVAAGLTLALFGLVVWIPVFSAVGVVTLAAGIVGWVRELLEGDQE